MVASTADQAVDVNLVGLVEVVAYRRKMDEVSAPVMGWDREGKVKGPEVATVVVCSRAFAKTSNPCSQT